MFLALTARLSRLTNASEKVSRLYLILWFYLSSVMTAVIVVGEFIFIMENLVAKQYQFMKDEMK